MDLVQRVCELRQSARASVVSEAGLTDLQTAMHVPDRIEEWIYRRIERWLDGPKAVPLLMVLSGNAGDGKGDLIQRLEKKLPPGSDVHVVPDATHADTPNENQVEKLAEFLRPFSDDGDDSVRVSLIAMNTGMALSFLQEAEETSGLPRFRTLGQVLKRELGVANSDVDEPTWEYEVINLDRRSIITGDEPLIDGMFEKLDPDNSEGVLYIEGRQCDMCEAREWCFVRTNLDLLRQPSVREQIRGLLLAATLTEQLHLTPRGAWDFLYQTITGGVDFFLDPDAPFCDKIRQIAARNADRYQPDDIQNVHERLLWQLLFEAPRTVEPDRGALFSALAAVDPVRRNGRRAHESASEVLGVIASDADAMADAAVVAGGPPPTPGDTNPAEASSEAADEAPNAHGDEVSSVGADDPPVTPDPLLLHFLTLLNEPDAWQGEAAHRLARGVVRRAVVLRQPAAIADELEDKELGEYSELLHAYGTWTGGGAPRAVRTFTELLHAGIASIFGRRVATDTYFRQDSFSPASRYPAYVKVPVEELIEPVPDDDVARGREWLSAVRFVPATVAIAVRSAGEASWTARVDLPLYRLLREVTGGYSASSVDLERFFGLRFACESLGSSHPDADELLIADLEGGVLFRLARKVLLGQESIDMRPLEAA